MDVHCSTCEEPWDTYHLQHYAIFETGLSVEEGRAWRTLPRSERLNPRYREEFKLARWEFGISIVNVVHCPCCPKDAVPNPVRVTTKASLEELLGDDEDGLASTFNSYHL